MIHATSDLRPKIEGYFEKYVKDLLNRAFSNPQFFTISEVAKYRPSEDESIWRQNRGLIPEVDDVYYKGEWLCDIHSKMSRDNIIDKVNKFLILKKEKDAKKELEQKKKGGELIL